MTPGPGTDGVCDTNPNPASAFIDLIEDDPENPEKWLILGQFHRQTGNSSAARMAIARALELDPGFGNARLALSMIEAEQGRWNDALRTIAGPADRRAIVPEAARHVAQIICSAPSGSLTIDDLTPETQEMVYSATLAAGDYLSAAKMWDGAIQAYSLAVQTRPDSLIALNDLACAHLYAHCGPQMDNPLSGGRNTDLSVELKGLIHIHEAIKLFHRAREITTDNQLTLANLGQLLAFLSAERFPGAAIAARTCLIEAFRINPDGTGCREAISDLFYAGKQFLSSALILGGDDSIDLDAFHTPMAIEQFMAQYEDTMTHLIAEIPGVVNRDPEAEERMADLLTSLGRDTVAAQILHHSLRPPHDNQRKRDKLAALLTGRRLFNEAVGLYCQDDSIAPPPLVRRV